MDLKNKNAHTQYTESTERNAPRGQTFIQFTTVPLQPTVVADKSVTECIKNCLQDGALSH